MSVIHIEIEDNITETKEFFIGKYLCYECHEEMSTSMNVGQPLRTPCARCGATRHPVYKVII